MAISRPPDSLTARDKCHTGDARSLGSLCNVSLALKAPMKTKRYSRPRPFVALTRNNKRETLMCSTNAPAKKYIVAMVGPFKTNRGAAFYRANPGLFFKSVNQVERIAKEVK